jgi:hypothetical protein
MLRFRFGFAFALLAGLFLARPAAAQNPSGSEFQINQFITGNQRPTSVAAAVDGGFVVVWDAAAQDGSGYGVFARKYDAFGGPGAEFQVNVYTTNPQSAGVVTVAADGSFLVAWHSSNQDLGSAGLGIYGRRYNSAGTAVGTEIHISTTTTGNQQNPSAASLPSGSVVVWDSPDGGVQGIFGQRLNTSGAPVGGEFPVNTYTSMTQQRARVAAAPDGRFVVVWESQSQDGNGLSVFGRRYDGSGSPLSGEFQVNTYTTSNQAYPAVSMASDGSFVVLWASAFQDGSQLGVFGQRFDPNGVREGSEFRVNTWTTNNQSQPSVASASDGSFVVTWRSYAVEPMTGVRAQMYDAQGGATGQEFAVNTYITGQQGFPFVSSAPNGAFVVVWRSGNQDGNVDGVFGQRYQYQFSDLIFADGFES